MPVIDISTDKIYAEFPSTCSGSFKIKNTGGGVLSGNITSNSRFIKFAPDTFEGNDCIAEYVLTLPDGNIGEVITTSVLISSNGGEVIIPVAIKIATEAMKAPDGEIIATLKDFYGFCKKNRREAVKLFLSEEFVRWLNAIGFEHMEILEYMKNDVIAERALDNFLILTNQKKKTGVLAVKKAVNIELMPNSTDKVIGRLRVKKTGQGYIDAQISTEHNSEWLRLNTGKITANDFKDREKTLNNDETEIIYTIDPVLVKKQVAYDTIVIKSETVTKTDINVRIKPLILTGLSSESYYFNDEGYVYIENNSGRDVRVEFAQKDNFIRFDGKAYYVAENKKIPFNVKTSLINQKQLDFKKKPYIESELYIRVYVNDTIIKKTEKFLVGYALLSL